MDFNIARRIEIKDLFLVPFGRIDGDPDATSAHHIESFWTVALEEGEKTIDVMVLAIFLEKHLALLLACGHADE